MSEKKQKNQKKSGKVKIIILSVLLVLLITAISLVVYTVGFHEPDNHAGSDETKPFEWIETTDTTSPDHTEDEPVEEEPKDKQFNFLLLGRDQTSANTDVIMIINLNVTSGEISILQLPRDTYIELDNTSFKLNALYHHFTQQAEKEGENDPDAYSLSQVSRVLEKNLCININYYAMVNLKGFRNIVDILGGVVAAKANAQGTVYPFWGQAHCAQHSALRSF